MRSCGSEVCRRNEAIAMPKRDIPIARYRLQPADQSEAN
jgi:hypothetical protein